MIKNFSEKILLERHEFIKQKVSNNDYVDIQKLENLMFEPVKEYLDIKQKYFEEKNYKIKFVDLTRNDWSDSYNADDVNGLSAYLNFKLKDNTKSRLRFVVGYYARIGIPTPQSGYTAFVDEGGTGSLFKPNSIEEFTEKFFRPIVDDDKLINLLFPVIERTDEFCNFLDNFFAKYIATEIY